jgi:hypothetical protein
MEAVKKMWEKSLEQVCMFVDYLKLILLLIFCSFAVECRHSGTSLFSQLKVTPTMGNIMCKIQRDR